MRFVSATNRDLAADVARGAFRQDLYYRLDGISLTLPPLRRRVEEIGPLSAAFASQVCRRMERRGTPSLSGEALSMLERHTWPGNIRELRNAVERAVVLCRGDRLLPEHFPAQIGSRGVAVPKAPPGSGEREAIGSASPLPARSSPPTLPDEPPSRRGPISRPRTCSAA